MELKNGHQSTAIHKIVLLRPSGRTDVRISAQPPPIDECFVLDRTTWRVTRIEQTNGGSTGYRFICERVTDDQAPGAALRLSTPLAERGSVTSGKREPQTGEAAGGE